jgi:hypothetical protein
MDSDLNMFKLAPTTSPDIHESYNRADTRHGPSWWKYNLCKEAFVDGACELQAQQTGKGIHDGLGLTQVQPASVRGTSQIVKPICNLVGWLNRLEIYCMQDSGIED